MATINVVTSHYTPEITAAAHRMDAFVDALAVNHTVNVFTLTEIGKPATENVVRESDRVTVHYINLPKYKKSSLFFRTFYEIWYSLKLARLAAKTECDVTMVTSPFMFLIPFVILSGGTSYKIADVRDLTWRYVPDKFIVHRAFRYMFTRMIEYFLPKYDHITVTNPSEKRWISENAHVPAEHITILSNGISKEKFDTLVNIEYNPEVTPFTITYVGNIGNGQNLQSLISVVEKLNDVRLVMIGNGNDYEAFKKQVRKKRISNIYFTGKLSWDKVLPYYKHSSVLFARLDDNYRSAIPSKLFEYLSTGLPVIYCGEGEAAHLLKQFNHTTVLKSHDDVGLKRAIKKLKANGSELDFENRDHIQRKYIRELINMKIDDVIAGVMGIEIPERTLVPVSMQEGKIALSVS
jgi:glycosyltransferase involved in cell wall biosynthesis